MQAKVEICGVNTAKLPLLSSKEKMLASPSRCLSHRRVLGAGLVIKAFLT